MRSFSREALDHDSGWLLYQSNPQLAEQIQQRIKRIADVARDRVGTQVFPRWIHAQNAVCSAAGLTNQEHLTKVLRRLKQADGSDDTVREAICDAIPLLMKPPRHSVRPVVIQSHHQFAQQLCDGVGSANLAVNDVLEMLATIIAGKTSGFTYTQLMRGVPPREGQSDDERLPPRDSAEFHISVAPDLVMAGVAPVAAKLKDPTHYLVMDGRIREAAMSGAGAHAANLRAQFLQNDGEAALHRFEAQAVRADRGAVGTQNIGALLSDGLQEAYAYWQFTKETQGAKAPLTLQEFFWRTGEYGKLKLDSIKGGRKYALQTTVRCPACDSQATAYIAMLPSENHQGNWTIECACGHRESKRGQTPGSGLRLSIIDCKCQMCARERARLMEEMRMFERDVPQSLKKAVDLAVACMLKAHDGLAGFRATEDGELWQEGIVIGRYLETRSLPAEHPQPSKLTEVASQRHGLPVALLLERQHGYTRLTYHKPVSLTASLNKMRKAQLERLQKGYGDEATFADWAYAALDFALGDFIPLPLAVSVWAADAPVPPWVPRKLTAALNTHQHDK